MYLPAFVKTVLIYVTGGLVVIKVGSVELECHVVSAVNVRSVRTDCSIMTR